MDSVFLLKLIIFILAQLWYYLSMIQSKKIIESKLLIQDI